MNNNVCSAFIRIAVCAIAFGSPVSAFADFDAAIFGTAGMVNGEAARISVTNIADAAPPSNKPCRAELSFVDAAGNTLVNADALPYLSQVTLAAGTSATLTFPAPGNATGPANRITFRPVVRQLTSGNGIGATPGCLLAATHEIFSTTSGVTLVAQPQDPFLPQDPMSPQDPLSPQDPIRPLGPIGITPTQVLRFSAVNVSAKIQPPKPCQVELSLVGPDGQTLRGSGNLPAVSQVTLLPGVSASLDFRPPAFDVPGGSSNVTLAQPVIRQVGTNGASPQCAIVTSAQLVGAASGSSGAVAIPVDPIIPAGSPQDPTRNAIALFGFAGIVAGQTARVSVVNRASSSNSNQACRAQLSFVDGAGNPIVDGNAVPVRSQVTVAPGTSASLTLPAPGSATGTTNRLVYRPVVTYLSASNAGCHLIASHEVVDTSSGITRVTYPPQPIIPTGSVGGQFFAATPLGQIGATSAQIIRFSAVNLAQASQPGASCRVELSFVGPDGQVLFSHGGSAFSQEFVLPPGAVSSLDFLPAGDSLSLARPVIRQIGTSNPSSPQCGIVTSAEALDSVQGVTTSVATPAFQPQDPIKTN
ncbi:hypothetical protein QF000_002533 [Paraburkholderia atlantica]|uniref:hypothetical protein n=1 Tax=Paraburkholderia atlantica TaxID=2654982 RepID=UPI003D2326A7